MHSAQALLQMGRLRAEKCELEDAEKAYCQALEIARAEMDLPAVMEAIAGLLRLASECADDDAMEKWNAELDRLIQSHPRDVPALVWFCKGTVAWYRRERRVAQSLWHRYIRTLRTAPAFDETLGLAGSEELFVKGWVSLALMWMGTHPKRSEYLVQVLHARYGNRKIRSIHGLCQLILGNISEKRGELQVALGLYQKAHGAFLQEHNWYYHLYALYGYARVARLQQNYPQAYWYLDLVEKAAHGSYFVQLKRELALERGRLEGDAVDLLIDSRRCVIQTRDSRGQIELGKQYVLLHILEALSEAHGRMGDDSERGLSKGEIIEKVWKENYRPEAHDNKLYYNINRLRKLLEPDVRKPQYLLNWKEGYRLAPGLKLQFVGGKLGGQLEGIGSLDRDEQGGARL